MFEGHGAPFDLTATKTVIIMTLHQDKASTNLAEESLKFGSPGLIRIHNCVKAILKTPNLHTNQFKCCFCNNMEAVLYSILTMNFSQSVVILYTEHEVDT